MHDGIQDRFVTWPASINRSSAAASWSNPLRMAVSSKTAKPKRMICANAVSIRLGTARLSREIGPRRDGLLDISQHTSGAGNLIAVGHGKQIVPGDVFEPAVDGHQMLISPLAFGIVGMSH